MDTWWNEMETRSMNDPSTVVNHSQMMSPFNEMPFNKPFYTFSPPHSSNIISNYSYSSSVSANTVAKSNFENLSTLVKTEMPSGTTINFSSSSSVPMDSNNFEDDQRLIQVLGFGGAGDTTQKKIYNRTGLQVQDHVLAERKRRERLTQRFIALSTLLPNLKKLDKASVLGDAIQYIKQLEEQVKTLEGKAKKCSEEPVIAVKRPRLVSTYADSSSSDEISSISTDRSFPDIEVRVSDGNFMISIYCKKQTGIIKEIFNEVEKLHLSIISCSVMPFGYYTSHMTIIAQMDHELSMTPNHVSNIIRAVMMKEEASSITA
ncbi:transcription factor bHLH18-like [Lycium ferocissimum]|uniref:transcription factor bHLH18-like n=1 Tax=Lycium ferocissimum TaxID=112874 RepID=UPI002814E569|nr:transcription factor bHLH18-like [Lycium ferocissimum]